MPMQRLIEGIVDFREQRLPQYAALFRELSGAQDPDALFITCADSRVVPDLLVLSDPGELFTMRNVGNLIPPADGDGGSTGDLSEASAVEYAVLVLEVPNIVVCGHSGCGAMKAVLKRQQLPTAPNLSRWLHHAAPALQRLERDGPLDASLAADDQLSQLNVLAQLDHLMTYRIVRERAAAGTLGLTGWWFDIATGNVCAYDPEARKFRLLDRQEADRLLGTA
jgi:carbonic anhydrase